MKFSALLLPLAVCFLGHLAAQETASPNDTAKFLAGLPIRDTPLAVFSYDPSWVDHATEFDKAWAELDARQLSKIRAWGPEFLGDAWASKSPLLYFFSGPDILYAQAFFPNASTYVLAGLEPAGAIPDITRMPKGALPAGLANLRKSLNSVLSFSFFITKDMKVDLKQNQLGGTLPVLYVFLARAGCQLETVEFVGLDKEGAITQGKASTHGVRIVFFGPSGAEQTLYYFETNLSNEGIKANPGFIKFCEQLGAGHSLIKAASYLMHLEEFGDARNFLLEHSSGILQDDSGIPFKDFDSSKWLLRFFGSYTGPISIFKKFYQPDLANAYVSSNPPPLPFSFGYRWHPRACSLILATPK
jgi:hypothetical protein